MRHSHSSHESARQPAGTSLRSLPRAVNPPRPHRTPTPLRLAALLPAALLLAAWLPAAWAQVPPESPAPGVELQGPDEGLTDTAALEEADARYQSGDLQGAAAAYKQLLAAFPDSAQQGQVLYRLGDALVRLGRPEEARLYWERLLATVPDSAYTEAVEDALLPIYRREGELDKALDILLARLGRAPVGRKGALLVDVAQVHLDLGEPEKAIRDLMRRQRYLPPEQRSAGLTYVKEVIDTRLSEAELKELVERFPEAIPGTWILERLVLLYAGRGETYLTERWGDRYLDAYPGRPFANEVRRIIKDQRRAMREDRHRVGVLLHLTGPLAEYGHRVLRGVQVAYRMERARLPEGELALWVRDLDGPAPLLSSHFASLLREADPEVVVGPMLSAEVRDTARQAERAGVPLIAPLVPRPDGVVGPVVGLGVSPDMEGVAAARYAAAQGLTRFVTVAPDEAYGRRVAAAFRAELERLGGQVQSTVFFGDDEEDIRARIQQVVDDDLKQDGMPAVTVDDIAAMSETERKLAGQVPEDEDEIRITTEPVAPLQGPPVGPHPYMPGFDGVFLPGPWDRIAVAAPHLPFFDIRVPVIGTSGWNDRRLIRTGGPAVTGARFVSPFFRDAKGARDFTKAYRDTYGEAPDLFAALGFDAMQLAARAVLGGDGTARDRLAGPFAGATGEMVVGPDGAVERTLSVLKVGTRRFTLAGEVSLAPERPDGPEPPLVPGPGPGPAGMGAARPVAAAVR